LPGHCPAIDCGLAREAFRHASPADCDNPKPQSLYLWLYIYVTPLCRIGVIIAAILELIVIAPLCRIGYGGLRQSSR
jgi:hypothetical protein